MAPEVRMNYQISGTRDGEYWPRAGETINLPEEEAAQLISQGMASALADDETADADTSDVETATPRGNQSLRAQKAQEAAVAAAKQEADAKAAQEAAEAEAAAKAAADAAAAEKAAADAAAAETKVAKK